MVTRKWTWKGLADWTSKSWV